MRWSNYHVHSVFCDGKNTLKEMAQAAEEAGITSLGFPGMHHLYMPMIGR